VNEDPNITLTLPLSVVNYLLALCDERPHKESHRVFAMITDQATATALLSDAEQMGIA